MNSYIPLEVKSLSTGLDRRFDAWEKLFASCPGMNFYLKDLLEAYYAKDPSEIITAWEAGAPRPVQRMHALDDDGMNLVLFGKASGTGKTTCAFERIWREIARNDGTFYPSDCPLPITLTGYEFATGVAANVRELDSFTRRLIAPDHLFIDDLDKRGSSEGMFTPVVQQTLFQLIEARTTRDKGTILTLNSNGNELLAKFDEDIGPYILRRLRERFTSIDFDPVLPKEAANA